MVFIAHFPCPSGRLLLSPQLRYSTPQYAITLFIEIHGHKSKIGYLLLAALTICCAKLSIRAFFCSNCNRRNGLREGMRPCGREALAMSAKTTESIDCFTKCPPIKERSLGLVKQKSQRKSHVYCTYFLVLFTRQQDPIIMTQLYRQRV